VYLCSSCPRCPLLFWVLLRPLFFVYGYRLDDQKQISMGDPVGIVKDSDLRDVQVAELFLVLE
jgi:hypothetical protein